MGFVSDAEMEKLAPAAAAPKFISDADMERNAPAAPAAPVKSPTFLEEVGNRISAFFDRPLIGDHPVEDVKDAAAGLGKGILAANDFAARAILHPVDTFGGGKAGAVVREGMRGVNSNIPFANLAVEHAGGAPEVSPADAAAAPGAQPLGSLLGAPVAGMEGSILARAAGAAAPRIAGALERAGAAAEERGVERAVGKIEERANKRARAGVQTDVVDDLVREDKSVRRAAGDDTKLSGTIQKAKERAGADLKAIYADAAPVEDIAGPIAKLDQRIAELDLGTSSEAAVARQLEAIREELNNRYGKRDSITAAELRAEQSDFQKRGYGKSMPGDEAGTVRIEAAREASKAIGDAVVQHVTGMDYTAAKAAAKADPKGLAARLFKANDTLNAAHKIEAAITDRAGKVKPETGIKGALKRVASHTILPVMGGITHGAGGMLAGAAMGEALHAAPMVARGAAAGIDRGIAGMAPGAAATLRRFIAAADKGNPFAKRLVATIAASPGGVARLQAAGAQP